MNQNQNRISPLGWICITLGIICLVSFIGIVATGGSQLLALRNSTHNSIINEDGIYAPGVSINSDGIRAPGLSINSDGIRLPGLSIGSDGINLIGIKIGSDGLHIGGTQWNWDNRIGSFVEQALDTDKGTLKNESTTHTLTAEEMRNLTELHIDIDVCDVTIESTTADAISFTYDGSYSVHLSDYHHFSYDVEDDELSIEQTFGKYNEWRPTTIKCLLTISLPQGWTGDMNMVLDIGKIEMANLTLDELELRTDVGDISLEQVTAKSVTAGSDVGGLVLQKLDSDYVRLNSSTGDVTLQITTLKPDVEITTDVGSVEIVMAADAEFTYRLNTDLGDVHVSDALGGNGKKNGEYRGNAGRVNCTTSVGGIRLDIE